MGLIGLIGTIGGGATALVNYIVSAVDWTKSSNIDDPGTAASVPNSLAFVGADSANLYRTPSGAGNQQKWTWSTWLKLHKLGTTKVLLSAGTTASDVGNLKIQIGTDNKLEVKGGAGTVFGEPNFLFTDCTAWYSICVVVDTTEGTGTDRLRIWINGVEVTSWAARSDFAGSTNYAVNSAVIHSIGRTDLGGTDKTLSDFTLAYNHQADGQALTADSFGEMGDNNVWYPKAYSGAYGTNGWFLQFDDQTSGSTLGNDDSGSGNNFTAENIVAVRSGWSDWSRFTLHNTSVFNNQYPRFYLFDDNETTACATYNGNVANSGYTWSASGVPAFTGTYNFQVRTWGDGGNPQTITVTHAGGTATWVNNTGNEIWNDFGTLTNVSAVKCARLDMGIIHGFKIDGSIVVEDRNFQVDSFTDSPSKYGSGTDGGDIRGNFCTLDPSNNNGTLSRGNLYYTASNYSRTLGTASLTAGKWYWECEVTNKDGTGNGPSFGIAQAGTYNNNYLGNSTDSYCWYSNGLAAANSVILHNNSSTSSWGTHGPFKVCDIVGVAFDADAGTLDYYLNGQHQGEAFNSINVSDYSWMPAISTQATSASSQVCVNFGQRPFTHSPPSGYKPVTTKNAEFPPPVTTSGSYTGNGNADGPFIALNGKPTKITIGGNTPTDGTHIRICSNGFKVITTSSDYNTNTTSYSYTVDTYVPYSVGRAGYMTG